MVRRVSRLLLSAGESPYIASQVPQSYNSKETTEELRFESQFPGPVQLVTGVFYQRSTFAYLYNVSDTRGRRPERRLLRRRRFLWNTQSIVLSQIAGFADLTYKVSQSVELSIGARKARLDYSTNEAIIEYPVLDANSQFSYSEREQPVTPRYVARYNFDKDNTAYVSASKGFRIGGVSDPIFLGCSQDAANLGLPVGVPIPYHSDSLWSYEVGLKNLWNDQRLATRFAVYDIDWKNIQQNLVLPTCGQGEELNAGAARIHGAEGSSRRS